MAAEPLIVVGVDESWQQTGALDWALDEALQRHLPLRAVHVVDDQPGRTDNAPVDLDGQTFTPVRLDDKARQLTSDVASFLHAAATRLDVAAPRDLPGRRCPRPPQRHGVNEANAAPGRDLLPWVAADAGCAGVGGGRNRILSDARAAPPR